MGLTQPVWVPAVTEQTREGFSSGPKAPPSTPSSGSAASPALPGSHSGVLCTQTSTGYEDVPGPTLPPSSPALQETVCHLFPACELDFQNSFAALRGAEGPTPQSAAIHPAAPSPGTAESSSGGATAPPSGETAVPPGGRSHSATRRPPPLCTRSHRPAGLGLQPGGLLQEREEHKRHLQGADWHGGTRSAGISFPLLMITHLPVACQ